ncbi:uncharacterized protein LOC126399567 isoform X1 [Epinephelus moara]|uniref:uncharacterized protein LOC126399567 isoform X1 n=2 Tax=Epinephelus moara TaxID=300413 RepID=UPI00214ED154|nr:uncharacterized protein LOC126399567 isoform X1 [Epinephelus moara]XP_049915580.1 uncharacterized protein LOC126399567 isoform X1 [Epinephelus moara]
MAVKMEVLNHLEELTHYELKKFQWYLIHYDQEGHRHIPRSHLESASRMGTVDRMVQAYGRDGAVETTMDILVKIHRNDLAIRLTQAKRVLKVDAHWIVKDLSCPVCHDIFTEPVMLQCGDSVCKSCVRKDQRRELIWKCPHCWKETHTEPQVNSTLKRLCENYRKRKGEGHLISESVSTIQASLHQFKPSYSAQNGSNLVAPVMSGNNIGGSVFIIGTVQGSVVSSKQALNHVFADSCGALQPQNQDWSKNLMACHYLSCCMTEAASLERATAFNKTTVGEFFDNLSEAMDRYRFPPNMIYNVAVTGFTPEQTSKQPVAVRGKTQVGIITPAESESHVTVVCAVNATGNAVPPMFIFPGVEYNDHFITGAPPGSTGASTPSGWINEDTFAEFLECLVRYTNCSTDHPVLLILDEHQVAFSQKALDIAKRKGIVMLSTPAHTSHRLQPLHKSVFGPFQTYYNRALDGWLRSNPGKTASIYQIPGCVKEAFMSAMMPRNINTGFTSTGIFPYNRDIFSDEFEPDVASDRPNPVDSTSMSAELPLHACAPPSGTDSSPHSIQTYTPCSIQ